MNQWTHIPEDTWVILGDASGPAVNVSNLTHVEMCTSNPSAPGGGGRRVLRLTYKHVAQPVDVLCADENVCRSARDHVMRTLGFEMGPTKPEKAPQ